MTEDKAAAYTTLYTVLVTLAKLTAPYTPFIAEMMYTNLVPQFYKDAPVSVHLCSFPEADESFIDAALERGMDGVLDIVVLGRAARNTGNVKNRQPLAKMIVVTARDFALTAEEERIVLDELNVKRMEVVDDAAKYISYTLKPQLKTLGPKYGKKLGQITAFLNGCNADEVVAAVKDGGEYAVADIGVVLSADIHQVRRRLRRRGRQGHYRSSRYLSHPRTHRRGYRARTRLQDTEYAQGGGLRSDRQDRRCLFGDGQGRRSARKGGVRRRRPRPLGVRRHGRRLHQGTEHKRRKGRAHRDEGTVV